ncbi:MAG: enoyl-ACP reductase [Clostridiales bacterium]|jgi:enoyl-[acyl-carrier protein] reductase I|nr:enoyl-ACP reductase [Clostridiales bacterium]
MADIVKGRKILIMGLRNKWSIAWGITKRLYEEGAELAFTYQGERDEPGVRELLTSLGAGGAFPLLKCDIGSDDDIDAAFAELGRRWGRLDGLVHAVAHANSEDLQNDFLLTSRAGFAHAMDISAYSLVYVSRKAAELMPPEGRGAILTLTYMGSERVFPGYNVMGVAKAALESTVRYLAHSLGAKGIRVNAISSGPIKTLSAKAVKNFSSFQASAGEKSPLGRGVDADEIGGAALYLLSGLSAAVTGEIHYVDCGYNIMGGA